ncbi:MAG: hypothetical protein IPQ00_18025 [Chloracidobacterium sp.]|nr:hypothetical protein [Chloracidobacterium sp.]
MIRRSILTWRVTQFIARESGHGDGALPWHWPIHQPTRSSPTNLVSMPVRSPP